MYRSRIPSIALGKVLSNIFCETEIMRQKYGGVLSSPLQVSQMRMPLFHGFAHLGNWSPREVFTHSYRQNIPQVKMKQPQSCTIRCGCNEWCPLPCTYHGLTGICFLSIYVAYFQEMLTLPAVRTSFESSCACRARYTDCGPA